MLAGLAALLGATLMLCLGRTEAVLIVARVLQGISAAVVWTVGIPPSLNRLTVLGLALVVDTVGEARIGQAMAYVSSAMSMGLILGPVLGGIIYDREGYYAAFALAFALIGLDFVLRVILVEKKIAVRYVPSPALTEEENTTTIKLQQLSLNTEPAQPLSSEPAASEIQQAPSVHSSVRSSKVPMVIRILKYPRLLVALFLSFVQALILSAFDATLPLYVNDLFNFTALQAGMTMYHIANDRPHIHGRGAASLLYLSFGGLVMRSFWTQDSGCGRIIILRSILDPSTPSTCERRQPRGTSRYSLRNSCAAGYVRSQLTLMARHDVNIRHTPVHV